MRSWVIPGALVLLGLLLVSHCTVELREDGSKRPIPQVLRALARREDDSLAGMIVENGRLLEARLSVRDGRVVLTPPRWGIPVLDDAGEVDRRLAEFIDGPGILGGEGSCDGVTEIELSIAPEVSKTVRATFLRFLTRRGIRAVPWDDP